MTVADAAPALALPEGRLRTARVVGDPRDPLAEALDWELTGYAVFEPQETLLLDAEGRCVLTFREGVPELAYHTGTDRGGPAALADLAAPGPTRVELFDLAAGQLDEIGRPASLSVPPGMPAERLAGDPALAASTRRAAPEDRPRTGAADGAADAGAGPGATAAPDEASAVEAFLEDEAKIEAIREQAREEARARAEEWDLPDASDVGADSPPADG